MSPKFGTSGLRGLVTELTPDLVKRHIWAFLAVCDTAETLCVGRDLRDSSERIMADVISAARQAGIATLDCGALPTPALALAAERAGGGAVMVTGSHIPADRNGLKFYTRHGEITKTDEEAIRSQLDAPAPTAAHPGSLNTDAGATSRFIARYLDAFEPDALRGQRIGLYAHSAVGRDVLAHILSGMGAEVIPLGRSDRFIPVDTEAVDAATRDRLRGWVLEHQLDALVSTDGDSDRPLMVDDTGAQVPGDILGQITAKTLGAETVITPVSSNSGVTQKGFGTVTLTKIGSPYVIAAMQAAGGRVVGYEANGGFLLGFDAAGPKGPLPALLTRDCMLPLVVPLVAAAGTSMSAQIAQEPAIVTAADRLQEVPIALSQRLISTLIDDPQARADFLTELGVAEDKIDLTDGLRMHLADRRVLHIRPSGNAPELRIYVEGSDKAQAQSLLAQVRSHLQHALPGS